MSIDPIKNQPAACPPPRTFLQWWADQMYEGALMEKMRCVDYCKGKLPPGTKQTSDAFQKCLSDCDFFKRFAEWSRKN